MGIERQAGLVRHDSLDHHPLRRACETSVLLWPRKRCGIPTTNSAASPHADCIDDQMDLAVTTLKRTLGAQICGQGSKPRNVVKRDAPASRPNHLDPPPAPFPPPSAPTPPPPPRPPPLHCPPLPPTCGPDPHPHLSGDPHLDQMHHGLAPAREGDARFRRGGSHAKPAASKIFWSSGWAHLEGGALGALAVRKGGGSCEHRQKWGSDLVKEPCSWLSLVSTSAARSPTTSMSPCFAFSSTPGNSGRWVAWMSSDVCACLRGGGAARKRQSKRRGGAHCTVRSSWIGLCRAGHYPEGRHLLLSIMRRDGRPHAKSRMTLELTRPHTCRPHRTSRLVVLRRPVLPTHVWSSCRASPHAPCSLRSSEQPVRQSGVVVCPIWPTWASGRLQCKSGAGTTKDGAQLRTLYSSEHEATSFDIRPSMRRRRRPRPDQSELGRRRAVEEGDGRRRAAANPSRHAARLGGARLLGNIRCQVPSCRRASNGCGPGQQRRCLSQARTRREECEEEPPLRRPSLAAFTKWGGVKHRDAKERSQARAKTSHISVPAKACLPPRPSPHLVKRPLPQRCLNLRPRSHTIKQMKTMGTEPTLLADRARLVDPKVVVSQSEE